MPLTPDANLILMGLRGSGKSTLGKSLSRRLGYPFVDLDDRTARALGHTTVATAFRDAGEPAFRAAEAAELADVLRTGRRVLALGGGTPTAPGASALLCEARASGRAWVVYLHARPEVLRRRLAATDLRARPALLGKDALEEIETIYASRHPLYRTLADRTQEVDASPVEDDAAAIEHAWTAAPRA